MISIPVTSDTKRRKRKRERERKERPNKPRCASVLSQSQIWLETDETRSGDIWWISITYPAKGQ